MSGTGEKKGIQEPLSDFLSLRFSPFRVLFIDSSGAHAIHGRVSDSAANNDYCPCMLST